MNTYIQHSRDTKYLIPLPDQYDSPLTDPQPKLTPYQKELKKFADRYQTRDAYDYDSWIKEKTGYDREQMRFCGAEMDIMRGIAVPAGTLGNDANKVDFRKKRLPVDPEKVLKSSQEIPDYIQKKTRFKNYELRAQLQRLEIQPKRCQTCASEAIGQNSTIYTNINSGTCQVGSLETCGSVWACPVCRMKILNKRQDELNYKVDQYKKDHPGAQVQLITLTIPHTSAETLRDVKESMHSLFKRLLNSKPWKNFRKIIDGYDRVLETTYGENGWHYHIHMLTYTSSPIMMKLWDDRIRSKWKKLGAKYLKKEMNAHAFDMRESEKNDYLAKWAGVNELASTAVKSGKNGNYTISDLENLILRADKNASDSLPLSKVAELLFEYYSETKGNRLMTHSQTEFKNGLSLHKYYIQDERSDEEVATISEEEKKSLIPVAEMSASGVRLLSKNGHIAHLKDIFEAAPVGRGYLEFVKRFPQYQDFIKPLKNYSELPLFYFYHADMKGHLLCSVHPPDPFENALYKREKNITNGLTKVKPGKEIENHCIEDLKIIEKKITWHEELPGEAPF